MIIKVKEDGAIFSALPGTPEDARDGWIFVKKFPDTILSIFESGIPLFKWDGAKVIPRTPEEIAADRARLPPKPKTNEERLQALEVLGENLNAGFKRLEKLFGGVRR